MIVGCDQVSQGAYALEVMPKMMKEGLTPVQESQREGTHAPTYSASLPNTS
jgi:hypothetical protein